MGLEVELFDGQVSPDLICAICDKVFLDPVINACSHVFCQGCVKASLACHSTRMCPKCGTALSKKSHQASVELKRRLLNMVLSCGHGCGEKFPLAELPEHIKFDCRNVPTNCPNRAKGCREEILRCDIEWHMEDCDYRLVECTACSAMVVHRELFTHQKRNRCLEKRLQQQITQEFRRINLDVIKHRRQVDRDTLRLEAHQRKRILDHVRAMESRRKPRERSQIPKSAVTTRREPSTSFFLTETSGNDARPHTVSEFKLNRVLHTCTKCSKKFYQDKNTEKSCRWHPGPIVELFGGTCTMCGHQDYQKGCCLGYHTAKQS